ncbi:alcohol dehydrogenase catalytic domain-containing protein [Micromonospora endolithica]|uniref:Alcohol dehydrogenase n=1 Tax=Micromonospora endolithica TaxID=230091 RepID=A0A3A9YU78_9ACTN|nr:alcohol dehydrogenase catalytic domain-containing protein [Micromonospora endolithica]RKN39622.1 alcohol dehydrogenase [Micromonospora endolithica]TWJ22239.1 S-(hydroxymethyl)glutathione dehydrogenase/alcohol dehydrogenase [Micromonospora endolithica]
MRALLARGVGAPLEVTGIELPAPGPGEVRVDIRAAGVCHSDLSMVNGTIAARYPLALGHEAAGVVVEVGADVTRVAVGAHVVLNWAPPCRACWFCDNGEPWLCAHLGAPTVARGRTASGEALHVTLGLGALAEQVVVGEQAVIPVPEALPFEAAALLGCAVLTGVGAVRRTAAVTPGQSVAVIGLGGVGLSVVGAARAAGADPVLAVDVSPAKAELARAVGATEFLVADDTLSRAVRERTEGRGVDHAFECVGRGATIRTAWRAARRGGQVTVVGMGAKDDVVQLGALEIFHSARTLRSSVYGSSDPDRDLPELARAVLDGSLDLTPLITDRTTLDGAAAAFDRMARGEGARTVVVP